MVGKPTHNGSRTREYVIWVSMKQRCSNPKVYAYHRYGGRGIKVCDRWLESFPNFLMDMGKAPSPEHSLDRIDNDKNYEPNNCKWSTRKEQSNNRVNTKRITLKGVTKRIDEWSQELSITTNTLRSRINRSKWNDEMALMTPVIKRGIEPTIEQRPDEDTHTCITCNRVLPTSAFSRVNSSYRKDNGQVSIYVHRVKYCRKCRQNSIQKKKWF